MKKIVILLIIFLYSLTFLFWCPNVTDMLYWPEHAPMYAHQIMNVGSLFVINTYLQLVPHEILYVKLLGWFMCMLAILIPYFFLQDNEGRKRNLYALALCIIFMGGGTFQLCNPDTFTLLSLSILGTYVILTSFSRKADVVISSLLTSITILCRFPNLVAIFVVAMYYLSYKYIQVKMIRAKDFLKVLVYIILSCLFYFLLAGILCHSFDIVGLIRDSFVNMHSQIGEHSLLSLLVCYHYTFYMGVIPMCVLCVLFFGIYQLKKITENAQWLKWIAVIIAIIIECFSCLYCCDNNMSYNWITMFALLVWFVFLCIGIKSRNMQNIAIIVFIMLLSFTASAGSNNAIIKCFHTTCCFVPILIVFNKIDLRKYSCYFVILLFSSVLCYNKDFYKNSIVEELPGMSYFMMPKSLEMKESAYYDVVRRYGEKDHNIFYGSCTSMFMYWSSGSKPLYDFTFFQDPKNEIEITNIIDVARGDKACVVFDFHEEKCLLLSEGLLKLGFHEINDDLCTIYKLNKE